MICRAARSTLSPASVIALRYAKAVAIESPRSCAAVAPAWWYGPVPTRMARVLGSCASQNTASSPSCAIASSIGIGRRPLRASTASGS